ncbi:putative multidrug resistance protein fnx1 [Xylariaceae sp. FL1651]|nr:putative multidrug resistance protein fnx1 [Xylariaceae sp. FL1651]
MEAEPEQSTDDREIESSRPLAQNEVPTSLNYLQGRRLWLAFASLGVMMFMVTFEIPIVATSIVAITSDIGGVDDRSWLLTSYLLGYVAVIVLSSKLSDIYGRQPLFITCILIFLVASAACSAAQTINQLIIFRAFQGLGGGGAYSLGTIITIELFPMPQVPTATARLSIAVSLGLLLGPIIGGVISAKTTWRWIFIVNVPFSLLCLACVFFGMPRDFPYQGQTNHLQHGHSSHSAKSVLERLDIPGAMLLLFAVLALTAGFEEADSLFPWKSGYVITLLVLGGVLSLFLLVWERRTTMKEGVREPILPWRFFTNRYISSVIFTFFFLGGPFVISVYQLPQRFQLVNGLSGLDAGVRLIPFTLASPVGTGFAASISGRLKIPPIWIILAGASLQVVGFALLGTLPITTDLLPRTYGFEIIAGFGCGMNLALLFVIVPQVAEKRDQAVAMGSASQFRMMGSAVAAAVVNSVFNGYTRPRLEAQGISDAASTSTDDTKLIYAGGYNLQMIVLAAFAAAQIPATLLLWKRPQIRV